MKSATKIMSEFGRNGHPLGRGINREQFPELIFHLRQRLGALESELDLTPRSLKLLEAKLLALPPEKPLSSMSEEEVVEFVREIAAYVGEVLLMHTQGRLDSLGTLWSTHFVLEGGVRMSKEGQRRVVSSVVFSLGNIAAAALDMASHGKRPLLYQDYLSARKKVVKEELHRKKAE